MTFGAETKTRMIQKVITSGCMEISMAFASVHALLHAALLKQRQAG
jgi:hypothetical protein